MFVKWNIYTTAQTIDNMTERIEQQIKEQFQKAFYDTIKESVLSGKHKHIVRLYAEIRDRLAAKVRPTGRAYARIHEDFDVDLFHQMITNNAFSGESLLRLVNTTFQWIHDLQMPVRDSDTEAAKQRVLQSGNTMAEVVPVYVKEVHGCLDTMEQDFKEFYENRNHPVVQNMLQQAVASKTAK